MAPTVCANKVGYRLECLCWRPVYSTHMHSHTYTLMHHALMQSHTLITPASHTIMHLCTHAFMHSHILITPASHTRICSCTHALMHSHTLITPASHTLVHSCTHALTHSCTYALTHTDYPCVPPSRSPYAPTSTLPTLRVCTANNRSGAHNSWAMTRCADQGR